MSSCDRSDRVLDYVLGLMDGDGREEFERHLEGCSSCRRELELERAVARRLRELEPAPPDLAASVSGGLIAMRRRWASWRSGLSVAGMVTALAVLLVNLTRFLPPNVDRQLEAALRVLQRNATSVQGSGVLLATLATGTALAGLAGLVAWMLPEE
jgi:anti-sigma factor RsiW